VGARPREGVGFRWWVRARALELGLVGWAANLDDGRVEVVVEGPRSACDQLLAALASGAAPGRVGGEAPGDGEDVHDGSFHDGWRRWEGARRCHLEPLPPT
jgi:acylphosphatase